VARVAPPFACPVLIGRSLARASTFGPPAEAMCHSECALVAGLSGGHSRRAQSDGAGVLWGARLAEARAVILKASSVPVKCSGTRLGVVCHSGPHRPRSSPSAKSEGRGG